MKSIAERRAGAAFAAVLVLAFVAPAVYAADTIATDTPVATVESLHRGLVALSRDRPSADLAERYRALEPLVSRTHDLPYIAEFTLRRQWAGLTEADRRRFTAAFSRLSIMTYASRFKNASEQTFKSVSAEGGSDRARVLGAIARPPQADVPLEYVLQPKDGDWLIVNILADGVSDLALKRAEYQRVLSTGTIDDLIKHIEQQTARLQSG
jgi:phospholipid transport system substrate-binding protein